MTFVKFFPPVVSLHGMASPRHIGGIVVDYLEYGAVEVGAA
jgi:hypothetical protein